MPKETHTSPTDRLQEETVQERIAELEKELALLEADRRKIRHSEARFRILSELVTDCCWARWRSADGTVERAWVNESFTRLSGYTPEEFEQVGREGLVHADDLEKIQDFIDGPLGISEHEFRIIRKDGQVRWLHERLHVQEQDGGIGVYGATQDITVQKQAEEVLQAAHRQLEQRVEHRTAELRQVNKRLLAEVAERRQIEAELRLAKTAAEQSNRAKSRFLATMTHELRTPLHGIISLIELLREDPSSSQASAWIGALQVSADSLSSLVEEVLDFSKIEAEQLLLEVRPFSLRELAEGLRDVLEPLAAQQQDRLLLTIDEHLPPRVEGDGPRLRQVLLNLLDNAIKFTKDGRISLTMECGDAPAAGSEGRLAIRFIVEDSGVGMDDAAQQKIFDPFTQADASTTRRFGGTGLGLAISRGLVELLGGELKVTSALGQGARFFFTVPFTPVEEDRHVVDKQPWRGADHRILVAEDNPVNQIVISEQLHALGIATELVEDGEETIKALAEGSFDALLLDCHMPVMDGFTVTRKIRAGEAPGEHLPIIAITASAIREELEACMLAGMDDILTKPYRQQELVEKLLKWLPAP